jgi:cytoskeletal protein CcmA (bactofilin family)
MWGTREKISDTVTGNENLTLLGKGAYFKGTVNCEGAIRIDGRVEGEVNTTGNLIVGEQGMIKGIISAGTVTISGKINGTVTAAQSIQIITAGVLIGDIHTPAVAIQDGAHFHGMCNMGAHKWSAEQPSPDSHVHDVTPYRERIRPAGN